MEEPHPMMKLVDLHNKECNAIEVEINIPYGKIAGKWFGPRDVKPILCLHGWLDNCGTFDRLIPLLPKELSFLAIDFPGHGHSCRIPDGMAYHQIDRVMVIQYVMNEYGWDRLALMGHSMGASVAFTYAGLFPEKVELVIGLDNFRPVRYSPGRFLKYAGSMAVKILQVNSDERKNSEPPLYTYEEMVEALHKGSYQSVSREYCPYLLQRNIAKSKKYPEKYYFNYARMLKYDQIPGWTDEATVTLLTRIRVPQLVVQATESRDPGSRAAFNTVVKVLSEENPTFQVEYLKGTHHVHLNEPEVVAPVIADFLQKYWSAGDPGQCGKVTSKL
ncbi:hypothetical protein quinque_011854 [Culex quinquefasciatus]|uniref:probable serine hydrolase n=1 Tax=Culex quinquefasciatus TaxID=7176 RepID=UPI0018E2B624|nr:probable serine hydrolase [Culex quinquefasciatus]XP_038110223.1 probable serine hydrolase [Culex quinquefasciatus]XP_038110224.1 probable serine hydrolase [Culex quinquefasciatus]